MGIEIKGYNEYDDETYSKGKGHPCTGTEALYRPYGPLGE
jgi:hypothetical protein